MTFKLAAAGATCAALLAGCGSGGYYMVREPGSTTPYYTTSLTTSGSALKFKDGKTGNAVTLQNSDVKKISKEEFVQGLTAPVATPAPVIVVPAPAAATVAPAPSGAGASAPPAVAPAPSAVPIPAETRPQ
jgi:hypothetical protein